MNVETSTCNAADMTEEVKLQLSHIHMNVETLRDGVHDRAELIGFN